MIIHASVFKGFIATPDTYWGGNLAIFVGGLVGWNKGLIVDGHADVSITGGVPAAETGGLAGMVSGKVISSDATGSIDLAGFAGGLVGLIDSGSIISSHAAVAIKVQYYSAGGLAAGAEGGSLIDQSYAAGSVRTTTGSNSYSSAPGKDCYVAGGGLIASAVDTAISNSYSNAPVFCLRMMVLVAVSVGWQELYVCRD